MPRQGAAAAIGTTGAPVLIHDVNRIAFLAFLIALVGCGTTTEREGAAASSGAAVESVPATTAVSIDWTECVNDVEGYAISYPKSWHTATLAPRDECAFFDPEPFEISEGSEFPLTMLEAHWLDRGRSFGQSFKDLTDPTFERAITVDVYGEGQLSGLKLETEATGAGLLEKGTRTYEYLVNVDDRAFVVKTTELPGRDYENARFVVDEAVPTLRFFAPSGAATSEESLPLPVLRTRRALVAAAAEGDYAALSTFIPEQGFTYTYGQPAPGGAPAYWKELAGREDPSPLAVLGAILNMPYTKVGDRYVWPFAYDRDPASLTNDELEMLARIASPQEISQWKEYGHYLGWRTGISSDGTWSFFVAGD